MLFNIFVCIFIFEAVLLYIVFNFVVTSVVTSIGRYLKDVCTRQCMLFYNFINICYGFRCEFIDNDQMLQMMSETQLLQTCLNVPLVSSEHVFAL